MRRSAPLSPGSTATVPRFPASPASKNYLQRGTSHLDCEAVGSFALGHPPAQDQVGGAAKTHEVVRQEHRVLCLRSHLRPEVVTLSESLGVTSGVCTQDLLIISNYKGSDHHS